MAVHAHARVPMQDTTHFGNSRPVYGCRAGWPCGALCSGQADLQLEVQMQGVILVPHSTQAGGGMVLASAPHHVFFGAHDHGPPQQLLEPLNHTCNHRCHTKLSPSVNVHAYDGASCQHATCTHHALAAPVPAVTPPARACTPGERGCRMYQAWHQTA